MKKQIIYLYQMIINIRDTFLNDYFAEKMFLSPTVRSSEELIKEINKSKKSMSRFGDGEFSLIYGENLKFQEYSPEIEKELREILLSDNQKLMVCIPDVFSKLDLYTDDAQKYWQKYLHSKRLKILNLLGKNKIYYNTQITRFYIDYRDKSNMDLKVRKLKSIWNNRNCVIVEGEKSRLGIGNDFFDNAASIKRIICPSEK